MSLNMDIKSKRWALTDNKNECCAIENFNWMWSNYNNDDCMHIFNEGKSCSNISISFKPPMFGHAIKTIDADVTQNIFPLVFPMIMLWFFSCIRWLTAHHPIIFQQIISKISFELWSHAHEMVFYSCHRFGMQCLHGSYFRQSDIIETNKQRRHVQALIPPQKHPYSVIFI